MIEKLFSSRNKSTGWQIFASVLFATAIGSVLLITPFPLLLALLAATGVLVCSLYKPELTIITIVVLISSIIYEEKLPLLPIGIGSLHITDILLLFLIFQVVLKHFTPTNKIVMKSPLNKALAFFLFSTIISAFVSIIYFGVDFNTVFRILRLFSYYLIFYIITNLVTTKKQIIFLVTGLLSVAAIVAVTMLIQATVGDSIELMPGRTIKASALDNQFDVLRILPPGQTLIYISFITAICFAVFQRGKSLWFSRYFFLVIILGMGILLTYTRTYWIGIFLSMVLFMFVATAEDRKRLRALLVGGAALVILLIGVSWATSGSLGHTFNAVSERYLSLFAGKDLIRSSSLQDRNLENLYAIKQIENHPVLGIGLGNDYRPNIYGPKDNLTDYVHNSYLWLMMDLGIPGFLLFMWFYVGFLTRAIKNLKNHDDNFLTSVATGAMLAGAGILPMALVIPLFMEWHSTVVIATFMGLSETIIISSKVQVET